MSNIGIVLQAKGDLDGAMRCFREAERIDRAAFGNDHPNVAIRMNNIGTVLIATGDLDSAMRCFREAERINRAAFGNDHPNVATDVNNIGSVLKAKGDLDLARACYRESFCICIRLLGPRALNTLQSARNLRAIGVDPIALAREIAGPEAAAELAERLGADGSSKSG
jgi:tetratricopeptide (TPR) repeat protein